MIIKTEKYGTVELILQIEESAVDTFIVEAYSDTLGQLGDDEIDELQQDFAAEIQEYSYSQGGSRNHN